MVNCSVLTWEKPSPHHQSPRDSAARKKENVRKKSKFSVRLPWSYCCMNCCCKSCSSGQSPHKTHWRSWCPWWWWSCCSWCSPSLWAHWALTSVQVSWAGGREEARESRTLSCWETSSLCGNTGKSFWSCWKLGKIWPETVWTSGNLSSPPCPGSPPAGPRARVVWRTATSAWAGCSSSPA